jgi:hypothetical protein
MRTVPFLVAALAAAALACGPGSEPARPGFPEEPKDGLRDDDHDGFLAKDDCNDHDPNVWMMVQAFVDADRDGFGAGPAVSVCGGNALPPGYAWAGTDCDDANPSVWQMMTGYADADGDGVGAGPQIQICSGGTLPRGYAYSGGDCDDSDPRLWQELPYLYVDADGDGYTVASEGVVCSGANLPRGYLVWQNGLDCDDGDASVFAPMTGYVDADGDGVGSGSLVTVCAGYSLPHGYASAGSDCAPDDASRWQWLSYGYLDRDGDGYTRWDPGSICSGDWLPQGYGWSSLLGDDCDDGDARVWRAMTGYVDADGDSFGAGSLVTYCTSGALPAGVVATGGDCAPDDPKAWRSAAYGYRDKDLDGHWVSEPGTLCLGADALPAGYAVSATGTGALDCDDADPSRWASLTGYPDSDGDGIGAGGAETFCTAGALPAGYVTSSTDCAPDDPSKWQMLAYSFVDADGDGYTARATGSVCTGASLPAPYRATAVGNDCDDADPARYRWVVVYPDADGDGVGAPPREVRCLGGTIPAGYSLYGWDPNDRDPAQSSVPATAL